MRHYKKIANDAERILNHRSQREMVHSVVKKSSALVFGLLLGVMSFWGIAFSGNILFSQGNNDYRYASLLGDGSQFPRLIAQIDDPGGSGATPGDSPTLTDVAGKQCLSEVATFFESETQNFVEFINGHFKNKSANSQLIHDALNRYRTYRSTLYRAYRDAAPPDQENLAGYASASEACFVNLQNHYTVAEQVLRQHVTGTTSGKRTTALMEKLQAINGKMRGLTGQVAEMRGRLDVMADKIPGFTPACL